MKSLERKHIVSRMESQEKPATGKILACVGTIEQFNADTDDKVSLLEAGATPVDYYGNDAVWKQFNQRNAGVDSYVISALDSSDKKSAGYADCTGLVAVGIDKETGKNISILTHQDSKSVLNRNMPDAGRDTFIADLSTSLTELRTRCESGSIDTVVFGGWTEGVGSSVYPYSAEEYKEMVMLIGSLSQNVLGIDPVVVVGPNLEHNILGNGMDEDTVRSLKSGGQTIMDRDPRDKDVSVIFDTQRRRLYMTRPGQYGAGDYTFPASRVKEMEQNWTDDTWMD